MPCAQPGSHFGNSDANGGSFSSAVEATQGNTGKLAVPKSRGSGVGWGGEGKEVGECLGVEWGRQEEVQGGRGWILEVSVASSLSSPLVSPILCKQKWLGRSEEILSSNGILSQSKGTKIPLP